MTPAKLHPKSRTTTLLSETLATFNVPELLSINYDDRVTVVTEEGDTFDTPRVLVDTAGEFVACMDCGSQYVPDLALTHHVPGTDTFCANCEVNHP